MFKNIVSRIKRRFSKRRGQALVELLLTIGISAILFPALLSGFVSTRTGRASAEQRLIALAYHKEAQEALRVIAANGWESNISNGTFHPVESGTSWALVAGSETLNGTYTRQIVISDVYRDGNGDIAGSGTLDTSTKRATITVSWGSPIPPLFRLILTFQGMRISTEPILELPILQVRFRGQRFLQQPGHLRVTAKFSSAREAGATGVRLI
jgi:type II secretory pathway pseudopilin PulG